MTHSSRPNIIWLMADDMGYGDPACNGQGRIATPHMDRLASEGIRFTDAHASSSVCTPSRYSVLTGRYNWRSSLKRGIVGSFDPPLIDSARPTVASFLKGQGYATACIGKWHLGLDWQFHRRTDPVPRGRGDPGNIDYHRPFRGGPVDLGFDRFFGIASSLSSPPWVFLDQDRAIGTPTITRERTEAFWEGMPPGKMVPGWRDEEADVTFLEQAIALLRNHEKGDGKPFFLYLAPSAPHSPWSPPDFLRGSSGVGLRGDLVATIDWMVGQLLRELDRSGLADNTLFVVTSDNGGHDRARYELDAFGHKVNGDLRGFKSQIWEGGHRIPFLARWPQVAPSGTVCRHLIGLQDLFATCADIAGAPLPPGAAEDSQSFLPSLSSPLDPQGGRSEIVHHSAMGRFSIRSKQWKLIDACDGGGFDEKEWRQAQPDGQLYQLIDDTSEQRNLWDAECAIRDRLLNHLAAIQEQPSN